MNYNVSKLKRLINLLLVIVLGYGVFRLLLPDVYRFNPQYLVETSIFKNRSFAANTKEIVSPELKIKAYLLEEHSNPVVNVFFLFKNSGSAFESSGKAGLGKLLSMMLLKGAGTYNLTKFNEILEQQAIELSFDNTKDVFSGFLKFRTEDASIAAQMLNLALTRPLFDNNLLQQSKKDLEALYRRQQEKAQSYMGAIAAKYLFGKHPYHQNPYGNPETIQKLSAADLRAFMRKSFALDNVLVGISGDITPDKAGQLLDSMFKKLPPKSQTQELASARLNLEDADIYLQRSLPQKLGLFFGQGAAMTNEDFYPLKIALEIFSGNGLTSRVQKAAREKQGLTYGVYGIIKNNDKADMIAGQFSTTSENFAALQRLISEEWIKFGQFGATEEETEQAKNYLLASELLRYADTENLSGMLCYVQKKNLGLDFLQKRNSYIRNVNLDDVNRVAQKYFTKDNLRFFAIGDFEGGSRKENDDAE